MTRIIEIIKNTLILKKQLLEQELEDAINSNSGSVEERVNKGVEVLEKISQVTQSQSTLDSYINNNNNNTQ
jgi:hypothetical protein